MPQFVAPELQGVNEGVTRPIAPVQDTSAAALIQGVGGLAVEGVKLFAKKSAEADMQQLEQGFLQEQPELTVEEIDRVQGFEKKFDMLERAAKQKGRNDEFRIRAEAELKKNISNFPGLADEFRRIAGKTLGFDPTGESVRQQAEANVEQERAIQQRLDFYDKDATQNFGFLPGELLGSPEKQREYQERANVRRRISELTDLKRLSELTGGQVTSDPTRELLANAGAVADNHSAQVAGHVLRRVNEFTGSSLGNISQLTAEITTQLDAEQRALLRTEISQAKSDAVNQYLQFQVDFKGNTQGWTLFSNTITAPYDKLSAALEDETILKSFQTDREIRGAMYAQGIAGTPASEAVLALQASGLNTTNLLTSKVGTDLIKSLGDYIQNNPNKPAAAPTREQMSKDTVKTLASDVQNWIAKADDPSVDRASLDTAVINYAKLLEEGGVRGYNGPTMNAIVESMNTPELQGYTRQLLGSDPTLGRSVSRGLSSHTGKLTNTAQVKIDRLGGTVVDGEKKKALRLDLTEEGELLLKFNEDVISEMEKNMQNFSNNAPLAVSEQQQQAFDLNMIDMMPPNNADIRNIQRTTVDPLNNTVTTMANLFGITKKEAAKRLLGNTPYAELVAEPPAVQEDESRSDVEDFLNQSFNTEIEDFLGTSAMNELTDAIQTP
jgi:hypothetical protein